MRISEIGVTRLFGLFNHSVAIKLAERITIIHSPNGYGKTTLLRMVDSIASGRYSDVRGVPFRDFQIRFDSGQILQVVRVEAGRPAQGGVPAPASLEITLRKGEKTENRTVLPGISPEAFGLPAQYVERTLPYLRRVGSRWLDERSGELQSFEEIIRAHPNFFPIPQDRVSAVIEPDWLGEFRKNLNVKFIEVQRLLKLSAGQAHRADDEGLRQSVVYYSRELAKQIHTTLAEYATLSQSLDRSFPRRLVEQASTRTQKHSSLAALKTRLQQLEDRRAALTAAGLLDKETESFDLASLTDPTLTDSVLPVYAEDAEQKLAVFNEIAPKIELLKTIVDSHFQFKLMSISKERGFTFATAYPGLTTKPRSIAVAQLSSGEQHMLVLLYELLFTVQPNSLIMIDEPEISLHVAWQLQFLEDLKKITELAKIDILIATHAPAIINDRRDLMVELEAPAEGK
jgi:predicted ATP-binding protein involved in virulence